MPTLDKHILVIGGGLMGSSVAWQLARFGSSVTLLEQQSLEYAFGSSKGEARISRSLGPPNDIWSYLHNHSIEEAEILLAYLNKVDDRMHSMGQIYITSPVTYILPNERILVVNRALRMQKDNYEISYSMQEAKEKFGMRVNKNEVVIKEFKKHTGTINPKVLIEKIHLALSYKKQTIHYKRKVDELNQTQNGFEVSTTNLLTGEKEFYKSDAVVLAAGPHIPEILRQGSSKLNIQIDPKRILLVFFKLDETKFNTLNEEQKRQIINSFPLIDIPSNHLFAMIERFENGVPIIKAGGHFKREEIKDLDLVWEQQGEQSEVASIKKSLLQYFEMINSPMEDEDLSLYDTYSCVYSLTPNEVPIVDFLEKNLVVVGGMSGVGAKGSLTYGKIAANKLLGNEESSFIYKKTEASLSLDSHVRII